MATLYETEPSTNMTRIIRNISFGYRHFAWMKSYAQGLDSDQNSTVVLQPGQVSAAATVEDVESDTEANKAGLDWLDQK